jgi:hypothetical protein
MLAAEERAANNRSGGPTASGGPDQGRALCTTPACGLCSEDICLNRWAVEREILDFHLFVVDDSLGYLYFLKQSRAFVMGQGIKQRINFYPLFDIYGLVISQSSNFCAVFLVLYSVADPDPGSGIRCLFDPWIRDPE